MPYYEIDGIRPVVDPSAYVHPTAVLIGDVIVAENCYVGPCAVLRGDFGPIRLDKSSNLQDTCVMHGFPGVYTRVMELGHIGHGAILHGCIVGKNSLVGMNSVIMDESILGEDCIVGAMSFVRAHSVYKDRSMVLGSPAKFVREVTDQELEWKTEGTHVYVQLAARSKVSMVETQPLSFVDEGRKKIEIDYQSLADTKKG